MDVNTMWDNLINIGVSEETLKVVTCINGLNEDTMYDILFAVTGYRNFEQMRDDPDFNGCSIVYEYDIE